MLARGYSAIQVRVTDAESPWRALDFVKLLLRRSIRERIVPPVRPRRAHAVFSIPIIVCSIPEIAG